MSEDEEDSDKIPLDLHSFIEETFDSGPVCMDRVFSIDFTKTAIPLALRPRGVANQSENPQSIKNYLNVIELRTKDDRLLALCFGHLLNLKRSTVFGITDRSKADLYEQALTKECMGFDRIKTSAFNSLVNSNDYFEEILKDKVGVLAEHTLRGRQQRALKQRLQAHETLIGQEDAEQGDKQQI